MVRVSRTPWFMSARGAERKLALETDSFRFCPEADLR